MEKRQRHIIYLPNPDWTIKKTDFNSQEIKDSLEWVKDQAEEAKRRKEIDPEKLRTVINI